MKFDVAYAVNMGINKNVCEDAALLGERIISGENGAIEISTPASICITDGVGGNAGGEKASRYLLEQVKHISTVMSPESLRMELLKINTELVTYASGHVGQERMATTFTGIFFSDNDVLLAQCGNTRAYVLQGNFLKQITEDQTTYQWLKMTGNKDAAENCNRSEIRGAFGGGTHKYVEHLMVKRIFERGLPRAVLLTSDGIHDSLDLDEIEDIISDDKNASEKVSELVRMAAKKGAQDDCTAVLIEIE